MAQQDAQHAEAAEGKETFKPIGTLILMIGYILIFALAWGLVYFNELLARR